MSLFKIVHTSGMATSHSSIHLQSFKSFTGYQRVAQSFFLSQWMNNIACDSMDRDRSTLWRDLGSVEPCISPLTSKAANQTEIGLFG